MKFTLRSAENIFPTPLFQYEVEDAAALNRDLLAEIARRRSAEQGVAKSNKRGWHSDPDLFARTEPAQAKLAGVLAQMLLQATRQAAPEANLAGMEMFPEGWVNVNQPGAYNAPHDHLGAFWSGCYYVSVPEAGGAIEFLSPHKPLPAVGGFRAPITADKLSLRPQPGTVLIFPATLVHWVQPNDSKQERVTIAFNGRLRPKAPAISRPGAAAPPRS
jgi:uncharacterized protein (TIGR02466 family)